MFKPPTLTQTHTHTHTDKTIKLWKIHERKVREAAPHPGEPQQTPSPIRRGFSSAMLSLIREEEQPPPEARPATAGAPAGSSSSAVLRIPQYRTTGSVATATLKRSYANAHAYHVNSLSVNADGQTFISADDLRINLWSLECHNQSFSTCYVCVCDGTGWSMVNCVKHGKLRLTSAPIISTPTRHRGPEAAQHGRPQ